MLINYCVLEKYNALQLPFSPFSSSASSSPQLFQNIGEFWAKIYFTDHWTANTIHLFVATKGNSSRLFLFWITLRLLDKRGHLFAYH